MRQRITKADAIREMAHRDPSISNREIKILVEQKYGLTVESNQITKILGRYADRKFAGKLATLKIKLASEYLSKIGNINEAVRLLHICKGGCQ